jgi:tRNA(fMet)-specific endonuclease VapC
MKNRVLIDTSIWIEFFNKSSTQAGDLLGQLLLEGRATTTGIILTELLQGARIEKEFEAILANIAAVPLLEPTLETWIQAGRISFGLRRRGITIPTTDLVIGSLALQNDCPIFSLDLHFESIPNLKLFGPGKK